MNIVFLIGRIIFGGYFIMNGYNHFKSLEGMTGYAKSKGVPMPKFAVMGTGLLLLLGGLSVVSGLLPRIGILLLIIFILPMTFQMHAFWNMTDPMQKMGEQVNFYKNMALLGALIMMLMLPLPWVMAL